MKVLVDPLIRWWTVLPLVASLFIFLFRARAATATVDWNTVYQQIQGFGAASAYGAFFKSSHLTTHEPSVGKPGAGRSGAPSQPAAIIATA